MLPGGKGIGYKGGRIAAYVGGTGSASKVNSYSGLGLSKKVVGAKVTSVRPRNRPLGLEKEKGGGRTGEKQSS